MAKPKYNSKFRKHPATTTTTTTPRHSSTTTTMTTPRSHSTTTMTTPRSHSTTTMTTPRSHSTTTMTTPAKSKTKLATTFKKSGKAPTSRPSTTTTTTASTTSSSYSKKNDAFKYMDKNKGKLAHPKKPQTSKKQFGSTSSAAGKNTSGKVSGDGGGGEGGPSFGGVSVGFGGIDQDYHPHVNVGGLDIDVVREFDDYFSGKPMSQHPGIEPIYRANGKESQKSFIAGTKEWKEKQGKYFQDWSDPLTYSRLAARSKTRR